MDFVFAQESSGQVGPVAAALIAAGGGLVGGALTLASNLVTDSRRASRDTDAAETAEKRELRLAVRLVIEELADSEQLLRDAVKEGLYWPSRRALSTDVWTDYRVVLAQHIESPLTWRLITAAFDEVNRLNWLVGSRRAGRHPVAGFAEATPVKTEDMTREAYRAMRAGMGELERLIQVQGPASRMLREEVEVEAELWPDETDG